MRRIDVFREVSRSQEWLPYHGEIIKPATAKAIVRLYDQSSPKVQRRITLLLNSGVGVGSYPFPATSRIEDSHCFEQVRYPDAGTQEQRNSPLHFW